MRRQTTVLFCDLVDSTRLSGLLDPEDLQEVLLAFRDLARSVIHEHDGFLASYMGDGVLAMFGYPQAHEDDAQRAVRSGLALVAAIRALRTRPNLELHARVGIATGVVVVGPVVRSGATLEEVAVGQTTNLAARLQSFATPDAVIVSAATKQLVEGNFECAWSGAHEMKGFDEPIGTWQVLRERTDVSVRPARGANASPLVGRDEELRVLTDRWHRAKHGAGGLVIVRGEPGVGKSRLVAEMCRAIADEPLVLLRYACAPRFQNSALFPVIHQTERAAGILPDDSPAQKLDRLEALVERMRHGEAEPGLSRVLAALLSVPFGERYAPLVESAERWKKRTFEALKGHLYGTARSVPLFLLVEDVHWADPTTLEFLNEVLADIRERPLLVVATERPGFDGAWPEGVDTTIVELQRLGLEQAKAMLQHVAGEKLLPGGMIEHILSKGEGVPLFIEELTKTLMDSNAFDVGSELEGRLRGGSIPSTLQDSLAARLDRLSPVKEVVEVAAAIGREFECDLLSEVLKLTVAELDSVLETLASADLIRLSDDTHRIGRFKHVLLQDAAYSMLLRATRRDLHQRISTALEARKVAGRAVDPDVLAHHFIEAGEPERALPFLEQAAQQASSRAAHTESRRHLRRALDLLSRVAPSKQRDEHEVRLSVGLGLATSATQGYAAPEVEAAYQRSLELCRSLGHHPELFPALRGLCTFYIVRAALGTARDLGEECLRVAEQSGNPADLIESATALGYTLVYQAELAEGRAQLERAVELYRSHDGEKLVYPSLQDPAVASTCLLAVVTFIMGELGSSDRWQREALALVEKLDSPFNRAYAHSFAALHHNVRKSFHAADEHAAHAVLVAEEHGFPVWLGAASMHRAIARGNAEDPSAAIAVLTHMLALWQAGGAELNRPFFLLGLAQCHWAARNAEAALAVLAEALQQAARSGEAFMLSEQHRLRAEIYRATRPEEAALYRAEFAQAHAVARAQGAAWLELRALVAWEPRPTENAAELERLAVLVRALRAEGGVHDELSRAEALLAASAH